MPKIYDEAELRRRWRRQILLVFCLGVILGGLSTGQLPLLGSLPTAQAQNTPAPLPGSGTPATGSCPERIPGGLQLSCSLKH